MHRLFADMWMLFPKEEEYMEVGGPHVICHNLNTQHQQDRCFTLSHSNPCQHAMTDKPREHYLKPYPRVQNLNRLDGNLMMTAISHDTG